MAQGFTSLTPAFLRISSSQQLHTLFYLPSYHAVPDEQYHPLPLIFPPFP